MHSIWSSGQAHRPYRWMWGRGLVICAMLGFLADAAFGHEPDGTSPRTALNAPDRLVAEPADEGDSSAGSAWQTLSHQQLDAMRGGLKAGDGLMVSFGISRVAYVNDQLVTSTSFHVNDLTRMTSRQGSPVLAPWTGQPLVIQNGPDQRLEFDAAGTSLVTVLQNNMNDQRLRTQTIINISSNGLGALRLLNIRATLENALTRAAARR